MKITGRVWKFEANINTDVIMPGFTQLLPPAERPQHVFSPNRPGWTKLVQKGDIVVADKNFGTGSSRPAARVLKDLGIGCVLAESINGLFFRSCVNEPFHALEVMGVIDAFQEGDVAEVDFDKATVTNTRTGQVLQGQIWPDALLKILNAGGVMSLLESEGLLGDDYI
jgi:3-isopropylmalate/(R)-2-methylmalate dehydratase small subunit